MSGRRMVGATVAMVMGLILALAAFGPLAAQPARKALKVGTVGLESTYYAPVVVAAQKGYFEREGLQIEWVKLSDPDLVRAVAAGSLPLGIPEVGSGITAKERGADVLVVASFLDRYPYDLMVKQNIKSYQDLKGKVLAHWQTSPSVGLELLKRLLAQNGLKDGDYKVIGGGNSTARYAALIGGGIDGTILTTPVNTMAKQKGFPSLGGLYDIPAVFAGVIANGAWVKSNQADLVAWLRAVVRGFDFTVDPKNRDEVVALLAKEFKSESTDAIVADMKQLYDEQKFIVSWELLPTEKSMQGVIEILNAIGQVPTPVPPSSKYFELAALKQAIADVRKK
jgi:ABC-type nitrate/sulfonate/bicarbonate transport system substrate-binding protein